MIEKDRNAAAKILFDAGWTFEEIEVVLKPRIATPIHRELPTTHIKTYDPIGRLE